MEQLAPDLWQHAGPDLRMPGGVYIPLRMTIVRLPDGLLLYSPIEIDDAAAAAIDALGPVVHVVAPSKIHHKFVAAAAARWPHAAVHGAPGVASKRPDLHLHDTLGPAEPGWGHTLAVELVGGVPRINEVVMFHRPSGTLICADLVFHITHPANRRTRFALSMMGVGGRRLAQSRAWRLGRDDLAAARASVDRILAWPIQQVAPCHGEPIAVDADGLAPCLSRLYGGDPGSRERPSAATA